MGLTTERIVGFNPTLVRLRLMGRRAGSPGPIGFNPTLVRLRRLASFIPRKEVKKFQSHAGSIEAFPPPPALTDGERFQSHAGSIEACDASERRSGCAFVSIPRWFD